MATVNKNFKIKNGLVVEGATATVNGQTVLTETGGDAYILDLIGGETLITSVSNEFDVTAGELSIDRVVVDAYYDAAGSADSAETAANAYTDGRETAITSAYQSYADTAESDAISAAATYTDGRETAITTAYQSYADTAEADAVTTANAYTDGRETAITTAYQAYADQAEADAISTAAADATTKANAAQAAAELHADTAIANLVDSAPATLDTLNELAAALQDNPDIIGDLQTIAAGKQDTLTAGSNIDITGATISVTGLVAADISDFDSQAVTANTGLWDTIGAAAAAQTAAEGYADGLAVNYDAAGSAATAEANAIAHADALDTDDIEEGTTNLYFTENRAKDAIGNALGGTQTNISVTYDSITKNLSFVAENGVADSDTDDLTEGTTNLYFTDARAVDALEAVVPNFTAVEINSLAKQVAATTEVATASQVTAYDFNASEYRSAKFLIKTAYGSHTELTEVLLTLDTSDNIAITEYATIGTNGSAMTVTADYVSFGTLVRLRVTTLNNNSTVTVMGTLLA